MPSAQCFSVWVCFFVKVNGPYWNLITSGKVPYLELHPHVGQLRQYLEGCAEEPALLLNKERYWVEADFIDIQQQRQYESLFCLVEESRVLLLDFIKLVSFAMIKVIDKQLVDFLPGGQFCKEATPDELRITKFAHLTNLVVNITSGTWTAVRGDAPVPPCTTILLCNCLRGTEKA